MVNGVAVLQPLAEDPAPASTETEITLGRAVAAAAATIYVAMVDFQRDGELAPNTKAAGADRIAKVAMLQLSHKLGDHDFAARARAAGKAELHRQFLVDFSYNPTEIDNKVLDGYIDAVFEITNNVVALERAMTN
jgi:hypothetical protein